MTDVNGSMNAVNNNQELATPQPSRSYKRILVFLDGSHEAERALPEAAELARPNNAAVVIICRSHAGAQAYLDKKLDELRSERVNVQGYVVSEQAAKAPSWLVKTEKADAVVMTRKPVGRVWRWLGADIAETLRARTDADIFDIQV